MNAKQSHAIYGAIIAQLKHEGAKARARAEACDRALAALNGTEHAVHATKARQGRGKVVSMRPKMSKAGRQAIREAQQTRWKVWRAQQAKAAHKLAAKA